MPIKLSRRWDGVAHEANPLNLALEARKKSGLTLLDLTLSNPTQCGLETPDWLHLMGHPSSKTYRPEPQGSLETRSAIAEYYRSKGQEVLQEDLYLTSGTSEGYTHLLKLLCDPGDSILAPVPSYPLLYTLAELENLNLLPYRFVLDSNSNWKLDRDSLQVGIKAGARVILIVLPNNPTGHVLNTEDAAYLAASAEKHGLTLIVDEVFTDYLHGSALPVFPKVSSPVFYLHGLSKLLGLPQLKLSWIRVQGGNILVHQPMEWICDAFLSVGGPIQFATPELLRRRQEFQAPIRERLAENLKTANKITAGHSHLQPLWPQGGWSLPILCKDVENDEAFALELVEKGVYVQPGYFYDFEAENIMVVSLLTEPAIFAEGLELIAGNCS